MRTPLLYLFIFSFILFSCKKKDGNSPTVAISSPLENSMHTVLDTFAVTGYITDDEKLEYVKISLLNENNIPVASVITLYPTDNEYTLNHEFIIDNISLASGLYNLLVSASDGVNETNKYIQLSLNEASRELTGFFFTQMPTTNSVVIKKIKPDMSLQSVATASGDFSSAAASSKNQAFYMAGSETGALRAFELLTNSQVWTVPVNPLPGAPYFSDMVESDGMLYVSYFDGYIKAFDKNGTAIATINADAGYNLLKIAKIDDLIFSEQQQTGTADRKLVIYSASNVTAIQEIQLDIEIVCIHKRNDDNFFVFGNNGSQGYMKNYVMSDNGFWEPHAMPSGKVLSAERINDNTFIIGHENRVYKYTYNPNSLLDYIPFTAASFIKYEPLNNWIVIGQGSDIVGYNYNDASAVWSLAVGAEIKSLSLLYNK